MGMGTFWHIFGKSNNTTAVFTQGYLHLFLTITATRSASSAETKEEIVSKYVIAPKWNETLTKVIFDMQGVGQGKGVGWLEVKWFSSKSTHGTIQVQVLKAEGLRSADFSGVRKREDFKKLTHESIFLTMFNE